MQIRKRIDLQFLAMALPILCFAAFFSYSIWNDGSEMRRLEEAGGTFTLREDGEPFGANFSIPEFEDRHMELLNDMPNLTILLLADSQITAKGMADVCNFSKLKLLDLSGTGPLGESLANLPRLRELRLSRRKISLAEMQQVAKQTRLVQLYLSETDTDDEGLRMLANLDSLIVLNLRGCRQVTDRGLENLAALTSLKGLVLDGTSVTPSGLLKFKRERPQTRIEVDKISTLSSFQFLEKWSVSGHWDEDYNLNSLAFSIDGSTIPRRYGKSKRKTLRLTELELSQLFARPELRTLKGIHFGSVAVPARAIELMSALPELESFQMKVTQKNRAGLKDLSALKERLRGLSLWGDDLTDDDLAHLAGLTNLERMSFGGAPITDAGLIHFRDLTKLKFIYLQGASIDGSGLVHLQKLANLEVLGIQLTKLTDKGLEHLAVLPKLKTLYVEKTKVTPEGLQRLKDALPELKIYGP